MKLLDALEILREPPPPSALPFRIGLACGFNPLHFETIVRAEMRLSMPDRRIEIDIGPYGDFWGNLARLEDLEKQGLDSAVVLIEWPDVDLRLGMRHVGTWTLAALAEIVEHGNTFATKLKSAVERLSVPVIIVAPTLPMPPIWFTPGWQASTFELEIRTTLAGAIAQLAQRPNIRILNADRLDRLSPPSNRFDAEWELLAGFPYKQSHAAVLAEMLTLLIQRPLPKKGLITDLDGTLWRGILGDDGIDNISWDLDHRSHIHALYQQMLHALSEQGVLIGVASKNDPALVEEIFQRRDLILPRTAIFPVEAHWQAKSDSVARILKTWHIAAEAVVFVDDSRLELAEVSSAHPGIHCIQFPSKADSVVQVLHEIRDLFAKGFTSQEDRLRLESIRRSPAALDSLNRGEGDIDHFLELAEAELTITFNKESVDARAFELINKTNQFNLNGARHTESSWHSYLRRSDTVFLLAAYKDKYGPLGKIAVVAGRHADKKLVIDIWVMSCRAFARRIEHKCLEELFARYAAEEIEFNYAPTDRNGPLTEFLAFLLGAAPRPGCCLSRDQFEARSPRTFHRVLEAVNG